MELLPVVKYLSLLFAAGYGVVATLVDFHTERDGRKVLTSKGYLGISLLVLSSVLSLSTETLADREAREQQRIAREEQARLSNQLQAQLGISKSLSDTLLALRQISASAFAQETIQLNRTMAVAERQALLLEEQRTLAFDAARLLHPLPPFRVEGELVFGAGERRMSDHSDQVRRRAEALYRSFRELEDSAEIRQPDLTTIRINADVRLVYYPPPRDILRDMQERVWVFGPALDAQASFSADSVLVEDASTWGPYLMLRQDGVSLNLALGRPESQPDWSARVAVGPTRETGEGSPTVTMVVDFVRGVVRHRFRTEWVERSASDRVTSLLDLPFRQLTVSAGSVFKPEAVEGLRLVFQNGRRIELPAQRFAPARPEGFTARLTPRDIEHEPGEFAELFRVPPRWAR